MQPDPISPRHISEKSSCVRFAALSNAKHSRAVREKAVWRGFFFSKAFVLAAAVASLVLVGCSRSGKFALLNAYPICKFSGRLGPKLVQGDYQAPEGFYDITPAQMNPWSHEYLAFNTGFPNAFDRSLGRTGSFLMVHGGCESVGCYAMTDYEMEEIYGLADEAFKGGQDKIQLEAFPFQMTAENLARHADDPNTPFWDMLKKGSDAFLATGQPPEVAVCGQRYVFNPVLGDNDLDPSAPCPPGIESTPVAGAEQSPQLAPAVANQSDHMAYQNDDPIARKIEESFRGVH